MFYKYINTMEALSREWEDEKGKLRPKPIFTASFDDIPGLKDVMIACCMGWASRLEDGVIRPRHGVSVIFQTWLERNQYGKIFPFYRFISEASMKALFEEGKPIDTRLIQAEIINGQLTVNFLGPDYRQGMQARTFTAKQTSLLRQVFLNQAIDRDRRERAITRSAARQTTAPAESAVPAAPSSPETQTDFGLTAAATADTDIPPIEE